MHSKPFFRDKDYSTLLASVCAFGFAGLATAREMRTLPA